MLRQRAISLEATLLFFVGRPLQRASPLAPRCHCGMTKILNPDLVSENLSLQILRLSVSDTLKKSRPLKHSNFKSIMRRNPTKYMSYLAF